MKCIEIIPKKSFKRKDLDKRKKIVIFATELKIQTNF